MTSLMKCGVVQADGVAEFVQQHGRAHVRVRAVVAIGVDDRVALDDLVRRDLAVDARVLRLEAALTELVAAGRGSCCRPSARRVGERDDQRRRLVPVARTAG